MVKLYIIEGCAYCTNAQNYLKSKNVEFEIHDVNLNEEDSVACEKLTGYNAVPVITADDKNYVEGFDEAKIDALLGI